MNHEILASLGMLVIGLITTGAVSWFTIRRIAKANKRQEAFRWSMMFGLSICTFMCATPLLGQGEHWILILPLAGTWLSLDSLHRIGDIASDTTAELVSSDSETA